MIANLRIEWKQYPSLWKYFDVFYPILDDYVYRLSWHYLHYAQISDIIQNQVWSCIFLIWKSVKEKKNKIDRYRFKELIPTHSISFYLNDIK